MNSNQAIEQDDRADDERRQRTEMDRYMSQPDPLAALFVKTGAMSDAELEELSNQPGIIIPFEGRAEDVNLIRSKSNMQRITIEIDVKNLPDGFMRHPYVERVLKIWLARGGGLDNDFVEPIVDDFQQVNATISLRTRTEEISDDEAQKQDEEKGQEVRHVDQENGHDEG